MYKNSSYSGEKLSFAHTYDKHPPDCLDNKHCHDVYEILYVIEGKGRFIVEGTYFDVKPGTLMIIRPFEYHSLKIDTECSYERYVINFSLSALVDDAVSLFLKFMENDDDSSGKIYTPDTLSQNILPLLERFATINTLPPNEGELYAKMLMSELILFLSVSGGEQIAHNESELGAKVIRYLNENIERNISLDDLARRFFVSKYYLCRAFKRHNGISVHGYINQKRVMYAKQLIDSGETASGAAYKVGFGDYSAFYRAYVKVVGKAPTA